MLKTAIWPYTTTHWKIHKRLVDAGGLGPVVYILPARGGSKLSVERERCLQLMASGRTLVYVRPNPRPKSIFIDRDILTPEGYERAENIWNEFWKGARDGTKKDM